MAKLKVENNQLKMKEKKAASSMAIPNFNCEDEPSSKRCKLEDGGVEQATTEIRTQLDSYLQQLKDAQKELDAVQAMLKETRKNVDIQPTIQPTAVQPMCSAPVLPSMQFPTHAASSVVQFQHPATPMHILLCRRPSLIGVRPNPSTGQKEWASVSPATSHECDV